MTKRVATYGADRLITGFYDLALSSPDKGEMYIEIDDAQYEMLNTAAQTGKRPAVDENLLPCLLEPAPPSVDVVASTVRLSRDRALSRTDWLVARHQDETLLGIATTLTGDQFATLLKYRAALRNLSDASDWPYVALPEEPDFVTAIA